MRLPLKALHARVLQGVAALGAVAAAPLPAFAHAMAPGDKGYLMCMDGFMPGPFLYLGAKHMVTGLDHLLFLFGVVFFLYRLREIGLYVTLFALGHSVTLLLGVLQGLTVNPFAIDAIIGLSVVYKALDNLGRFQKWFGVTPDNRIAVLIFGLFHGMGLAAKLIDLDVAPDGLIPNLIAFNVGVEAGQIFALSAMLVGLSWWRRSADFSRQAALANVGIMIAGVVLIVYQLSGLLMSRPV